MERLGLFSEMGYISLGDRYPKVDPRSKVFNSSAFKGKQMLPGGSKTRSALQAGYFDTTFQRVLEGEGYSDSIKNRRKSRINETKKNISSKSWLPSSYTKKGSGLGNHYGTFSGWHDSFSPNLKQGKSYNTPGRNFTTTPGKKGTGYGYANVTFEKYTTHSVEPFDRPREMRKLDVTDHKKRLKGGAFKLNLHPKQFFDNNPYRLDKPLKVSNSTTSSTAKSLIKTPFRPSNPGKKIAGCKAGTFETYPKHSVDPYQPKTKSSIANTNKAIFHPSPGPKSTPTRSTLDQNVVRSINRNNYKNVRSVMAF